MKSTPAILKIESNGMIRKTSRLAGVFGTFALFATIVVACSSEPKKPLTIDQKVRNEMEVHNDEHISCFVDYQNRRGVIYGDLAFQFQVETNGKVSWVKVREDKSNIHDTVFRQCMMDSIKKIKFPELGERPIIIDSYPFHFRR